MYRYNDRDKRHGTVSGHAKTNDISLIVTCYNDPIRRSTHTKTHSLKLPTGRRFVWKMLPINSWFG